MSHIWTIQKHIDDSGERHITLTAPDSHVNFRVNKEDFGKVQYTPAHYDAEHNTGTPFADNTLYTCTLDPNDPLDLSFTVEITTFNDMWAFFHPGFRAFNPDTDNVDSTDTTTDELPELQLVQDPIIYNRPETGYSQENQHFFRFHNPNGKSAISIPMANVDYTRFDSLNDDTHQYVVVTKSRVEIRCVSTVNEQLGLEFRYRGVTHLTSAEESNNVRQITESRANPT